MERQRTGAPTFPRTVEGVVVRPAPAAILVIDRDPAVRITIEALVKITGCDAQAVATVAEGLVAIGQAVPGLIFLEGEAPFEESAEAIRALRDRVRWRIPVVLVGEPREQFEGIIEVLAIERLPKPFDARHLFSIIERHLSCPQLPMP